MRVLSALLCSLMACNSGVAIPLFIVIFNSFCTIQSHATDTITKCQQLNNSQTLVSANNIFKLGFFKPVQSAKTHFLGIWSIKNGYRKIDWIANPNNPVNDSSGILTIDSDGEFKITCSGGELLVSSSHHQTNGSNISATLLDSGNLVLREVNSNGIGRRVLWQSFVYTSDMIILGRIPIGMIRNMEAGVFGNGDPNCRTGHEFYMRRKGLLNLTNAHRHVFDNASLSLSDCAIMCWNNCRCPAYNPLFKNGTGCTIWVGELGFIENTRAPRSYYILTFNNSSFGNRSSGNRSECDPPAASIDPIPSRNGEVHQKDSNTDYQLWIWSFIVVVPAVLAMLLLGLLFHLRRKGLKASIQLDEFKEKNSRQEKLSLDIGTDTRPSHKFSSTDELRKGEKTIDNVHSFSYASIAAATDDFSSANELGEGGFGPVYKGKLLDGQEIAVKKLSRSSSQGLAEFKNEIMLIAKLQHTNLVRLLGCCIQGDEKMLVYEFMPNKSLDCFLFDQTKREILDWKRRFTIIEGIAQGLLYLHKYSRFRVIHRDLKAGNILLDNDMNPKISDFGMARIFEQNESEANTKRIVGTYGYMSPEYAMEGIFSIKSDVFSFGVLLLEIISGKKNTSLCQIDCSLNLIGYAWDLWKEGKSSELIDQTMSDLCSRNEILRYIQVGLLCVQENPMDRPTMSDVVYMLTNGTMPLPTPKQPAFCFGRSEIEKQLHKHKSKNCSLNVVTISTLEAR